MKSGGSIGTENVERIDGRNASGREPGWTGAQDFISQ
jgi:hypothetical protein